MFPVGVVMLSVGYALLYYAVDVLKWVHDPAHPKMQPPSLAFVLGASPTPFSKPYAAPVNTEGATNPYEPFGAATTAASSSTGTAVGAPPAPDPNLRTA